MAAVWLSSPATKTGGTAGSDAKLAPILTEGREGLRERPLEKFMKLTN